MAEQIYKCTFFLNMVVYLWQKHAKLAVVFRALSPNLAVLRISSRILEFLTYLRIQWSGQFRIECGTMEIGENVGCIF